MNLLALMPKRWHAARATTLHEASFQIAMQRWQESARLWHLAQQHGTRTDQIEAAFRQYEQDGATVRALYQQVAP